MNSNQKVSEHEGSPGQKDLGFPLVRSSPSPSSEAPAQPGQPPAPRAPTQKGCGVAGASPEQGHEDAPRAGAHLPCSQAGRAA